MLPGYILSLREGLEAALVLGIVLGALQKMKRANLRPIVWGGALSAVAISLLVAVVLHTIGASLQTPAEQIFEGITMLSAAGVLTWMIFWMQRQSRHIKSDLESGVRRATLQTGKLALFGLALIAVLREGVELALFLTAAALNTDAHVTLIGSLFGLGTAALLGWILFATTIRLDLRRFFQVTGILLILFAAGLTASAVHEFIEIGWIPAMIEPVWNLNWLVNENSLLGQLLSTLFGYNGSPSLSEALAYLTYFIAILVGLRLARPTAPAFQKA